MTHPRSLKGLGLICATHCNFKAEIKRLYPEATIDGGAGTVIEVAMSNNTCSITSICLQELMKIKIIRTESGCAGVMLLGDHAQGSKGAH